MTETSAYAQGQDASQIYYPGLGVRHGRVGLHHRPSWELGGQDEVQVLILSSVLVFIFLLRGVWPYLAGLGLRDNLFVTTASERSSSASLL